MSIPRPYPQPIDPITVGLSPLGTDDSNILQLEQAVNNLVTQFNNLVAKEKILQQELNYVRSLINIGYVTAGELSAALAAYAGTRNLGTAGNLDLYSVTSTVASTDLLITNTGGSIQMVVPNGSGGSVTALEVTSGTSGGIEVNGNVLVNTGYIAIGAAGIYSSVAHGNMQGATVSGTLVFQDGLYISGFPTGGTAGEFVGVTSGGGLGYAALDGTTDQIAITAGTGTFTFSLSSTVVIPGTIKPASAGGYLAHDGTVGASATTAGATFIDGLYTGGAITGGGGGGGIDDVPNGSDVLYVRESQASGAGVWFALDDWDGSTSITQLGTIGTGVWEGTEIGTLYGGTGLDASSAADGELLIGTGSGLTLATLTGTSNEITVTNSSGGITLSLPSTLHLGTITTGTWEGGVIGASYIADLPESQITDLVSDLDARLVIANNLSEISVGGPTAMATARLNIGLGNVQDIDITAYAGSTNTTHLGTIGVGVWEGTEIGTLYGGTGLDGSGAANGQLLIGNGSGYSLHTLTGTSNEITVTNASGTITLSLPSSLSLGTITAGTWNGTPIGATYVSNLAESQITNLVSDLANRLVIANNLSEISVEGSTAMATARSNIGLGNVQNIDITAYAGNTNTTHLGTISVGTWEATAIGAAYGGTGLDASSAADGELLIGTGSGLTLATISGNDGIGVTNGSGTIALGLGTITGAVWNGTTVQIAYGGTGATTAAGACVALGALQLSNNLSELTSSASTARSNLGLGSAATQSASSFFSTSSVIPTTAGGTGLTSIGTAGQVLVVNSGATGLTWVTNTAFTDVTDTGSYARTMGAWQQIEGTANQITAAASGGSLLFAIASPCTMPGTLNFGSSGYSITSSGNCSLNAIQGVNVIATGLLRAPFIEPATDSTTSFQMRRATGNVPYVNFDSSNLRVGIGNNFTNPAYTLDVSGTFNVSGNAKFQSLINTPLILPTVDSTTGIKIQGISNGVAIMQFDTVHNRVGIGSPAPVPAYTLDVAGDANISGWVATPTIYPYTDGTAGLEILRASDGATVCRFDTSNQIVYPNRLVLPAS